MRKMLSLMCLIGLLTVAVPAQAQLRQDVQAQRAPAKLYEQSGASFMLNKLFSPEHFRMSHSYEMSFGSFGGSSSSLGMYTNTMQWQLNHKLAARVDVAFAHTPFGGNSALKGAGLQQDGGRVFLRNAEIAYRPTDNTHLHFSIRQSPYGGYMSPYGYGPHGNGRAYGYSPYYQDAFGAEPIFWNDGAR